jgi:mono/diheme cytochrome c family protein
MQKMMEKKGIRRPIFSGPDLTDLITYIESVSNASPAGPLYVLPGNAADGRDMFVKKGCVECHSIRGAGGGAAPDLARRGVSWDLAEFAAAMWNKAPAMMARMRSRGISVPQLNPGEMADLLAYLYSVRYFAESGNMNAGRHLLRTRGCLTCHSLNARGADKAGDLAERAAMASPAEVVAVLWNHVKYTETGDSLVAAAWPVIGAKEMADIAAFLQAPPDGSF